MSAWQYIKDGLRHFSRIHAAVAAGVAVAAAVITGALLVGDSVRGSLRDLALAGLGRIDSVLVAEQPFREELITGAHERKEYTGAIDTATPMLITSGSITTIGGDTRRRASRLNVIGVRPEFWEFAPPEGVRMAEGRLPSPDAAGIALSSSVAEELGVRAGKNVVLLHLPLTGSVPADSTLGEKEETTASRRLGVTGVFEPGEAASIGRFSLRPAQQEPRNVFVSLSVLQKVVGQVGKANAAAFSQRMTRSSRDGNKRSLFTLLSPTLADFGLKVESVNLNTGTTEPYSAISAERLVLAPHGAEVSAAIFGKDRIQPAVTYLANAIVFGDKRIPYSTVVGVDSTKELGPLLDDAGEPIKLADDEVALNDWAAENLGAAVGDSVTVAYYEPETTHGELREHAPPLVLKVAAIVPLADADGNPTAAADPHFAPELPGVTDEQSIADWDLPFKLVEKVRKEDEDYWDKYRTTPKAFISHALAARLWGTRWGTDSVLRIPASELEASAPGAAAAIAKSLEQKLDPAKLGMSLLPVKSQAIAAATGTTPFDGLFLGFSFFLLASAVMLTSLLFKLGVEGRAREAGLLAALGVPRKRHARLMLGEGAVVATIGAIIGALAGIGYARLMIHGLNTWWVDATATPFLKLHVTPRSVVIGFLAGLITALATIRWSLRGLLKLPPRQLLAGDAEPPLSVRGARKWSTTWLPIGALVGAIALGVAAGKLEGESRAGAFFGAGALALIGALAAVRRKLREPTSAAPTSLSLSGLAARNARRNPGRTMLALGLAATASFLIVALSAFRLAPTERGAGGFDLLGYADLPIHYDLATPQGRQELGFSREDDESLADATVLSFRVRDGEDASCLNLYQTAQPRVLGAPVKSLADSSEFAWADGKPSPSGDASKSPWLALDADLGRDDAGRPVIPMILDRNTAFYSLKLYAVGKRLTVSDAAGQPLTLEIVGLLANSILQGDAIISEANFLRAFPEVAGRRFFLVRGGKAAGGPAKLASLLETRLEDYGFDAVDARGRLAELMAVQNTYLSTFQSLGALGLLLGAAGLAVVQLRSVAERRGELALMQAAGFRRRRLMHMVLAENLVLLVGGLAIGCLAAVVAVVPQALLEQVGAPWRTLSILLGIVAVTGATAAWLASRSVLRAPLLPALRGE